MAKLFEVVNNVASNVVNVINNVINIVANVINTFQMSIKEKSTTF